MAELDGHRGARAAHLAPRAAGQRRHGAARRHGGLDGQGRRRARRGRGLPLLRPHLHDRLLPAPDRPAAHRRARAARCARRTASASTTSGGSSTREGRPVDEQGRRLTDPDGRPLPRAPRTPLCDQVAERYDIHHEDRRRLVPLLRRQRAQARRLLLDEQAAHQRRQGADRLLLQGPQGLLRHVLRHEGPVLTAVLVVAAFVAGLTGAWSPCGFSMVAVARPQPRRRAWPRRCAACAAFVAGRAASAARSRSACSRRSGRCSAAATPRSRRARRSPAPPRSPRPPGVRIAPQIRRQVPEHWRRVLPLPVAAASYGVLLGLGFTTFVLTFAVPALAGVSLAVGDPVARPAARPRVRRSAARCRSSLLAPFADRPLGLRALELMAERPGILRGFRAADALALARRRARARRREAPGRDAGAVYPRATDPSAAGAELAWQVPGAPPARCAAPRRDAAPDGRQARDRRRHDSPRSPDGEIRVDRARHRRAGARALPAARRRPARGLRPLARLPPHRRARRHRGRAARRRRRARRRRWRRRPTSSAARRSTATGSSSTSPAARRAGSTRSTSRPARGARCAATPRIAFTNPSLLGGELLYVETTPYSQRLELGAAPTAAAAATCCGSLPRSAPTRATRPSTARTVVRAPAPPRARGPGGTTTTLWTTALAADAAYVTRLRTRDGRTRADLLRVAR